MIQPNNLQSNQTNTVMISSPAGTTFECKEDVFDGIDDIYADLEAAPPPPSSADDIIEARRLNLNSSMSSSSPSSSSGSNHLNVSKESLQYEREFPYFCGIHSPKNSSKLTSMWNIFKAQNYIEMEEKNERGTQNEPPTKHRAMDNVGTKSDTVETKETKAEVKGGSSIVCARDTIIRHTIDEDEAREEHEKKVYPSVREILRQKQLFGVLKENEGPRTIIARNNSTQRNMDEDTIRKEKVKKYHPSFWDILGQRKIFGVSIRLLLLVFVNLFALIILVILISRFTGRNVTGSDSSIDKSTLDSTEIIAVSVDVPSIEDDDQGNDVSSKLRSLCDEEGVTVEDGVILTANQVFEKGKYFCSPSKNYILGMMEDLAIVDIRANEVVWSAGVTEGARTILQADGSMVIENEVGEILWNTQEIPISAGDFNHQLVFWENNEGVIAIQQTSPVAVAQTPSNFWMDGVPEFEYCNDCQTDDLEFPVRGTFYFPTFDNIESAWRDRNGNLPIHYPSLGLYSSSDPDVVTAHVEAMEYGKIDLAISSWLGSGTNYDRSRMTMLLEETSKQNAGMKWTVSYEVDRLGLPSPEGIQSNLEYLKKWFAWQNAWAHIDGKPVIYVNNDGGCDVAERWMTGAATDWYVVLRVFDGYERCEYQPDSWYDQRVKASNDGIDNQEGLYYNLAPGQWRIGRPRPDLERSSPREWCDNVQDMVESNEQWQMIVSFNNATLGTSIEPSLDWRSASRYGFFLDCLHDSQMF